MDRITVNVRAPGEADGPQEPEVERHADGWITVGVRPHDGFKPGPVELTLVSGPQDIDFVEGTYEATVAFVADPPSRENSRVLFVGPT